jgi:methyl-accepting chemotaxis protein
VPVAPARTTSTIGVRSVRRGQTQQRGVSTLHRFQKRLAAERGAANTTNLVVVAVVVVAGLLSVVLLTRTTMAANRINHKADRIAQTGRGINIATDSVVQLRRTNETAASILASAEPLEAKLTEVVTLAQGVDGLAGSINGTASAINGTGAKINGTAGEIGGSATKINKTAKEINKSATAIEGHAGSINGSAVKINATAKDINLQAAAILDVANRINADVAQINKNLDATLPIAQGIKGDTGNIVVEATRADKYARCIDHRLGTPTPC